MIFDSPAMKHIMDKHEGVPDHELPFIIQLTRRGDLSDERKLLEECILKASKEKQNELLGHLYSGKDEQFIGAWFELMLLNWLLPVGEVEVEPNIQENYPDFLVRAKGQEIIVEAKAILIDKPTRQKNRWHNAIFKAVEQINLPYSVDVLASHLISLPDLDQLAKEVNQWLLTRPDERFEFNDRNGNVLVFKSEFWPNFTSVSLIWESGVKEISTDAIKKALREKAKGNKAIRRSGYPYIIALFIEDFLYDYREVVRAWFGETQFVIDTNNQRLIETRRDQSGLHLYRREISHRTVSGTLVFKLKDSGSFRGHRLEGWYIENPYAKVKVDASIFPVKESMIVVGKDDKQYKMDWVKPNETIGKLC